MSSKIYLTETEIFVIENEYEGFRDVDEVDLSDLPPDSLVHARSGDTHFLCTIGKQGRGRLLMYTENDKDPWVTWTTIKLTETLRLGEELIPDAHISALEVHEQRVFIP